MTCQQCFEPTPMTSRGPAKYCSQLCKSRAAWAKRKPKLTTKDHRAQYERSARYASAERPKRQAEACVECGEKTIARDRCHSHYRHLMRQEGAGWAFLTDHASRAKHYGVDYESIDRLAVFAADGWECQLCHNPVDQSIKRPDPMSASLDHIVPMSKGGGHIRSNVQLAHLGCNKAKGDGGVQDRAPEVLELSSAGLSRAQVADATGLTVRTVAWIRRRYS